MSANNSKQLASRYNYCNCHCNGCDDNIVVDVCVEEQAALPVEEAQVMVNDYAVDQEEDLAAPELPRNVELVPERNYVMLPAGAGPGQQAHAYPENDEVAAYELVGYGPTSPQYADEVPAYAVYPAAAAIPVWPWYGVEVPAYVDHQAEMVRQVAALWPAHGYAASGGDVAAGWARYVAGMVPASPRQGAEAVVLPEQVAHTEEVPAYAEAPQREYVPWYRPPQPEVDSDDGIEPISPANSQTKWFRHAAANQFEPNYVLPPPPPLQYFRPRREEPDNNDDNVNNGEVEHEDERPTTSRYATWQQEYPRSPDERPTTSLQAVAYQNGCISHYADTPRTTRRMRCNAECEDAPPAGRALRNRSGQLLQRICKGVDDSDCDTDSEDDDEDDEYDDDDDDEDDTYDDDDDDDDEYDEYDAEEEDDDDDDYDNGPRPVQNPFLRNLEQLAQASAVPLSDAAVTSTTADDLPTMPQVSTRRNVAYWRHRHGSGSGGWLCGSVAAKRNRTQHMSSLQLCCGLSLSAQQFATESSALLLDGGGRTPTRASGSTSGYTTGHTSGSTPHFFNFNNISGSQNDFEQVEYSKCHRGTPFFMKQSSTPIFPSSRCIDSSSQYNLVLALTWLSGRPMCFDSSMHFRRSLERSFSRIYNDSRDARLKEQSMCLRRPLPVKTHEAAYERRMRIGNSI